MVFSIFRLCLFLFVFVTLISFCDSEEGDLLKPRQINLRHGSAAAQIASDVINFVESTAMKPRLMVLFGPAADGTTVEQFVGNQGQMADNLASLVSLTALKHCVVVLAELDSSATYEDIADVAEALMNADGVEQIESDSLIAAPNAIRNMTTAKPNADAARYPQQSTVSVIPNDYYWSLQWGMSSIRMPAAWEIATGAEIGLWRPKIMIIDSGIDYTHPDIVDNVWVNQIEAAGEAGVDDDGNGYIDDIYGWNALAQNGDPMDDYWHGTHCAGIAGAVSDNARGVAGVHWKPLIQGCKFLDANGSGSTSNAVVCIDYSIATGSWVSNNSWGSDGFSPSLQSAIKRAAQAGQLFVTSAGNAGRNITSDPYYPPSYGLDNIIGVASLQKTNALMDSSNYGKDVHVAAPGQDVASLYPGGGYAYGSGTSMAAPHVAGLAALVMTLKPTLNYNEVIEILSNSILDIDETGDNYVEWDGKIDGLRALQITTGSTSSTSTAPPTTSTTTSTTTMTATTTLTTTTTPMTSTTTTITTTTTVTSQSQCPTAVLGPSTITCRETCELRRLSCDDPGTNILNLNIEDCYSAAETIFLRADIEVGNQEADLAVNPTGCFATFWKGVYTLHINPQDFGTSEFGCDAPPATQDGTVKLCSCLSPCIG